MRSRRAPRRGTRTTQKECLARATHMPPELKRRSTGVERDVSSHRIRRAMPQRSGRHCPNGANGDSPGQRPGYKRPTQTAKPHQSRTEPLHELVTISGVGTPILWFGRMQSDRLRLPATISLPRLHSMESRKPWIQVFRRLHSSNSACHLGQVRCILPTS